MIEIKHGIVYVGNRHYYSIDLRTRSFKLDGTSPFRLVVEGVVFECGSWGKCAEDLSNYLIARFQPSNDYLLSLTLDWGKQELFTYDSSLLAYRKLECGLYINTNHTSIHLCWIIEQLLQTFPIDIDRCSLLIHRMPKDEDEEVRRYFYDRALQGYLSFISEIIPSVEEREKSLSLLSQLDLDFKKRFPSYYSLLLFESRQAYATVKSRFLEIINKSNINSTVKGKIKTVLDTLMLYYRAVYQS